MINSDGGLKMPPRLLTFQLLKVKINIWSKKKLKFLNLNLTPTILSILKKVKGLIKRIYLTHIDSYTWNWSCKKKHWKKFHEAKFFKCFSLLQNPIDQLTFSAKFSWKSCQCRGIFWLQKKDSINLSAFCPQINLVVIIWLH